MWGFFPWESSSNFFDTFFAMLLKDLWKHFLCLKPSLQCSWNNCESIFSFFWAPCVEICPKRYLTHLIVWVHLLGRFSKGLSMYSIYKRDCQKCKNFFYLRVVRARKMAQPFAVPVPIFSRKGRREESKSEILRIKKSSYLSSSPSGFSFPLWGTVIMRLRSPGIYSTQDLQ